MEQDWWLRDTVDIVVMSRPGLTEGGAGGADMVSGRLGVGSVKSLFGACIKLVGGADMLRIWIA